MLLQWLWMRKGTHLPPVWELLLLLTNTPNRTDIWFLVSIPKDTGKIGWTKLPKFRNGSRWFRTTVVAPDSPTLHHTTTAHHCSVKSVEMHTRLLKRIVEIISWNEIITCCMSTSSAPQFQIDTADTGHSVPLGNESYNPLRFICIPCFYLYIEMDLVIATGTQRFVHFDLIN